MYEKINWKDNTKPAINAQNLNHMDDGIYDLNNTLISESPSISTVQHNNIYSNKDILTDWDNGTVSANIANGKFANIYPGNRFNKTVTIDEKTYNLTFLIVDIDPFYSNYNSYAIINTHHVGVIVLGLPNEKMNDTNTTSGGYKGSYMYTTVLPKYLEAIRTVIGENHLVAHQKRYSNSLNETGYNRFGSNTGCSNNWEWTENQYISLLTEAQIYGATVWSSSGYDTGEASNQLAMFKMSKWNKILGNRWFWLRDVASKSYFARADYHGDATYANASNSYGVIPLLLLK